MSDYFVLESTSGHLDIEFVDSVKAALGLLKQQAELAGVAKSAPFDPEVDYLSAIITELKGELPDAMTKVGWPEANKSGDKLDDFILMLLKDLARAARGRGTNASARLALAGLGSQ